MRRRALLLSATVLLASCGNSVATTPTPSPTVAVVPSTTSEASPAPAPASPDPTTTTPSVTSAGACGTAFDLSVGDVERGDGRPDPELEVTCTDDTAVVRSNNMISFDFVAITPNDLAANALEVRLPLTPVAAAAPLAVQLGVVGVSVQGVALFAAFEAPRDGYRDPVSDGLLDACNGHTAQGGYYHHHARPDCIVDDPSAPDTVFGYALDGHEIVGPVTCDDADCRTTRTLASSYVRTGDGIAAFADWTFTEGAGDLDVCNGTTFDDGVYRYVATDEFPYLPFCFHGETDAAGGVFDGTPPSGAYFPGGPPA